MNGVVQVIRIGADSLTYESTSAGRKNGHMRTTQDRVQTANSSGYELKNTDKQIMAYQARIAIANQDLITNQQKQTDNSQEVVDFLTHKYTNEELYSLMEALFMSLKNMEATHHKERGHDLEVSKYVSLRQTNPFALLQLRENGACEFAILKILYDMDFPGHYLCKIKTVTLTMPCIIGPYTNVNCTLRLTAHKYRSDPSAKDKRDYVEKTPD
ncbi:hypothetical protein K469DRAFT_764898 [Zopfia rhizophila CBS 207.26]|uniref:Tc toxin complex TcA C-terminal TcB-binding domain-containing protein n=1 Tax=Zopfia rhizophila CBS 207.26 TaxID=1314779 RepID=A0A6A6D7U3_9PEZI|nr:hypothetical protein K469DRAFT_764898 [Zopfia rhizophila CBS 207.26]